MEKKKRVTHVKNVDSGDMRPADMDYVSSLINSMEANYEHMKPKEFKIDHPAKVISKAEQKKHERDESIQSTSKNHSQLSKSKKCRVKRKFPLLEKSKMAVKQLKHNQSIPKQRAHLSYLPTSPAKSNSTSNCSSNTLGIKGKTMANIKRPSNKTFHNERSENSSLQKSKSFLKGIDNSTRKRKDDSQNTVLKAHLNSEKIVPTSTKQPKASCKNVNKSNISPLRSENSVGRAKKSKLCHRDDDVFRNNPIIKNITDDRSHRNERSRANSSTRGRSNSSSRNNNSKSRSNNSSRNNNSKSRSNSIVNKESNNILNDKNDSAVCDTDSDFEKFVQEIKKGMRKTSEISRKKAKTRQKVSRKRTVRELSDFESSDDEGSALNRKKNKRRKVSHKKVKSKSRVVIADECEADPMDGHMFTRDSSPESDKSLVNATCSSLSVQSKENENYVSLPEPSSGKDKAKSTVLLSDEPEAGLMDGYVQKRDSSSHIQTDFGSLYVQSKDKDCYAVPESAITALNSLMASSFFKTLSTKSAKTCQKQLSCVNSSLGSDNSFENLNPISSESSMVIKEVSNVENSKNEDEECIELSSSEDECLETESLNSDVCFNSAIGKSSMTISVYSDAATATDPEKSDLKTVEAICHTPTKDVDIDIVDIIIPESKNAKISLETDSNCSAFSPEENSVNNDVQIIKCELQTRQILDIQMKKENEHPKNNVVTDNYHGAVFATDICKGFNSHEWPELHSDVNAEDKMKYASSEGSSCGQFTSNKINKENNDYIINSAETLLELLNEKMSTEDTNISSNQHLIAIKRELPDQMTIDNFSEHKKSRGLLEVKTSSQIMQDKSQSNAAVEDSIPSSQINKLNAPEKYISVSALCKFLIENSKTFELMY